MPFDFQISAGGPTPIFRQIADQVRLAVSTGQLPIGQQLPSVRALAEQLVVNPNTIAKAYGELARDGFIDAQQGRGAFVARPRQVYSKAERLRRIAPFLDALVNQGVSLGFTPAQLTEALQQRLGKLEPLNPSDRGG